MSSLFMTSSLVYVVLSNDTTTPATHTYPHSLSLHDALPNFLVAADDVHIAAPVDLAEIAGNEKAVRPELLPGLLRHAPVALEHVGPLHLDHADLVGRQRPSGRRLDHAQRHIGQREPHRAGHAQIGRAHV